MVDLRRNPQTGWNLLFGISILAIVFTLGFITLLPLDSSAVTAAQKLISASQDRVQQAQIRSQALTLGIHSRSWSGKTLRLDSAALDYVTRLAESSHVLISGFRTDTHRGLGLLELAPLALQVEGPFPRVVDLLKKLEGPDSKLAVQFLEFSNSDTGGDHVTANIGLIAYIADDSKLAMPKGKAN